MLVTFVKLVMSLVTNEMFVELVEFISELCVLGWFSTLLTKLSEKMLFKAII